MCERDIDQLHASRQLGTWLETSMCLTGNRTSDLSVLRLALNPLSHTSQSPYTHVFR